MRGGSIANMCPVLPDVEDMAGEIDTVNALEDEDDDSEFEYGDDYSDDSGTENTPGLARAYRMIGTLLRENERPVTPSNILWAGEALIEAFTSMEGTGGEPPGTWVNIYCIVEKTRSYLREVSGGRSLRGGADAPSSESGYHDRIDELNAELVRINNRLLQIRRGYTPPTGTPAPYGNPANYASLQEEEAALENRMRLVLGEMDSVLTTGYDTPSSWPSSGGSGKLFSEAEYREKMEELNEEMLLVDNRILQIRRQLPPLPGTPTYSNPANYATVHDELVFLHNRKRQLRDEATRLLDAGYTTSGGSGVPLPESDYEREVQEISDEIRAIQLRIGAIHRRSRAPGPPPDYSGSNFSDHLDELASLRARMAALQERARQTIEAGFVGQGMSRQAEAVDGGRGKTRARGRGKTRARGRGKTRARGRGKTRRKKA